MHPLERFGWVSGIVVAIIAITTFVAGNIAFGYRVVLGIMAILILAITAVWTRIKREPQPKVVPLTDSLRFYKYPQLICSNLVPDEQMTNMLYADIAVKETTNKARVDKCELEITLRQNGKEAYRSKVLSANASPTPNPISVPLDAGGSAIFHPLAIPLRTLETILPNFSFGKAGNFGGTPVWAGEYEIYASALYDVKRSEWFYSGKMKLPDDALKRAQPHENITTTIDQRNGFALFLERQDDMIRARFLGHNNDDDVKRIISQYLENIQQIDDVLDDNGKLRKWSRVTRAENQQATFAIWEEIELTDSS